MTAIDVTARDRTPEVAAVLGNRNLQALGRALRQNGREAGAAFHDVPAVVEAPAQRRQGQVDLFEVVLANVCKPQITGDAVEREAPDVAQAVGEDLGAPGGLAGEGVVDGNGVAGLGVNVYSEERAEQGAGILTVLKRIAARSAVAGGDVEVAVPRAEGDHAAVVVLVWLLDL